MVKKIKFQYIALIAITFVSFGIYFNSLNNSFVFDDLPNIVNNPHIRNLNDFSLLLQGIQSYTGKYRALPAITFAINYHLHHLNVLGYHLVNLLLHILSGFLVYFISRYLFLLGPNRGNVPEKRHLDDPTVNFPSLFAALIFITHPIQVNTVTYIVERNEGLASFFYLLAFLLFIKGTSQIGKRKILYFCGTGLSFLGSILSKEIGFTLPIILILFDLLFECKKREDTLKRLKIYIPLFLLSMTYILFFLKGGMLWLLVKGSPEWRWTPWENLLTQANVIIQYVKLLLLPLPGWLNIDHDFQVSRSFLEYPTWISVFILLSLLVLATILLKKKKLLSFSIFWFFIILAPTSSVIPIWDLMVEYRLYLPLFSYALLLVMGLDYLGHFLYRLNGKALSRNIVFGLAILLLCFYSLITMERNRVFKDELTLWSDALRKSPNKMRVHHNLGRAYFHRGQFDEAIREGEVALRLSANLDRKENVKFVLNLLGGAYLARGENQKALSMFQQAMQVDPNFATSYYNASCIYAIQHEKEKAIEYLRKGISLDSIYKEKARKDKDFDPLRGEKEFDELLK
ncbi:MAG TPA: tetratricopeptide repeat protein [Thermodesulfobacteriota bacterium]|nr:tetratricopeptide repeat protein [Thermodesulfobacteriota bacterium]